MRTKQLHREKSLGTIAATDVSINALPVIELGVDKLRKAAALAYDRNDSYRLIDGGDVYADDSITSHLIGILGEMAVASAYKTNIDMETYEFGDDGTDLELWDMSVDVKTTSTQKMKRPDLLVQPTKNLKSELYFLVHIIGWDTESVQLRLHGYASKETVTDREPQRHPGSDENYVVEADELTLPPWTQHSPPASTQSKKELAEIALPHRETRRDILSTQLDDLPHSLSGGHLDQIAGWTDGMTAGDLERLVNEAARESLNRGADRISWPDIRMALAD